MEFNAYQEIAKSTAIYPKEYNIIYPTLGLSGEAGEVSEKVKKVLRDENGIFTNQKRQEIAKELGDVLWYIANIASDFNISLCDIAQLNIEKLMSRQKRNKLQGSGDER
jgi:NTP pyrophosphatase (non-canonical NTP hydrolase)